MILSWLEKPFFVITLFIATDALLPALLGGDVLDVNADGNPIIQAVWTGIYLVAGSLFVARWRDIRWHLRHEKWLVALIGLAVASILWSAAPAVTARRAIALVGTTMVGLLLGTRFGVEGTLRLTAQALVAAAVLSLIFVVAVPELGIASGGHEGAWQGVFAHKNRLGRAMAIAILAFFVLARNERGWRWGVALLVALLLLFESRSATAVVISAVTISAYAVLRTVTLDYRLFLAGGIILCLIAAASGYWLVQNYATVLAALGRDPTLTGRTLLWALLLGQIAERPWLGYGYGAYWLGWDGPSASIWRSLAWSPAHGHNGYLDTALDLGVPAVAIAVVGVGGILLRRLWRLRSASSPTDRWPVLFLILYLVYNCVESGLLSRNNVFWILCVAVTMGARERLAPFSRRQLADVPQQVHVEERPRRPGGEPS